MPSNALKKLNRHVLCQALDALPAPTLIVEAQHRDHQVVYANPAVGSALGVHPNELIGRAADSLADSAFDPGASEPWRLRAAHGGSLELRATPLYDQPGKAGYWLLSAPVADTVIPAVMTTTGSFRAVDFWTRGVRDERADPTTGIPGRNSLLEVLARDWASARREQQRINVIVFRIDALESYRGLFGRHAADTCVRRVAHAIANSLQRATDYCARVGYDRFAVLTGGPNEERTAQFAERIAHRVRDLAIHHPRSQLARYVTVSWALASEVPGVLAEEPGLLEDAEARVAGSSASEAPAPEHGDRFGADAG